MTRQRIDHEVVNPYALDRRTGHIVVPNAETRIDQDATVEFYDPTNHKAHLTCPECEKPNLIWRRAAKSTGDKTRRRDHFYRQPHDEHDLFCEVGLRALQYPGQERVISKNKGAYVYLNIGKLPNRPPYKDLGPRSTSQLPPNLKLTPSWIKAIHYETNSRGYDAIANADFKDRPIMNAITDIDGFLKVIRTLNPEKLRDTWVINKGVAVRLDRMIIRKSPQAYMPRTPQDMKEQRTAAGLEKSFLMAVDPGYDRFAALLDSQRSKIRHPVLIHFKVAEKPGTYDTLAAGYGLRVKLAPYQVENPERKKPAPHQLALPHVWVEPIVNIEDRQLFDKISVGQEFFAIAHPRLSIVDQGSPNRRYFQHFNVVSVEHLAPMTQEKVADDIRHIAALRAKMAERKEARATEILLTSIPA
jgi:hypothetical protein